MVFILLVGLVLLFYYRLLEKTPWVCNYYIIACNYDHLKSVSTYNSLKVGWFDYCIDVLSVKLISFK